MRWTRKRGRRCGSSESSELEGKRVVDMEAAVLEPEPSRQTQADAPPSCTLARQLEPSRELLEMHMSETHAAAEDLQS
jgi:hypothetical protein